MNVLFLVHRIPFPPNKGDKIRSFHILKYLAERHRVFLGAFVDDPEDWRHADEVGRYCADLCLLSLPPLQAKIRCLRGFLSGQALSLPYYRDKRMAEWTGRMIAENAIDRILVFSSAMAQYVDQYENCPRVIDFVDVDADKWRQYSEKKSWPASWVFRREAECLLAFDRGIAARFSRSLFVSEAEAGLFARLAPEAADRVMAFENGVDTVFFSPDADFQNPYPEHSKVLVFTGAMDYWANVDAVVWFATTVFPELRRREPAVEFFVVGTRPTPEVLELGRLEGVTVTGSVPDVRPYLRFARLAVAPLRIARGIQNKVLEAMAMGRPILATPAALEGIAVENGLDVTAAETPEEWVDGALQLLTSKAAQAGSAANRPFVERRYAWERSLARLGSLLESP